MSFNDLPAEMRAAVQWVIWRYELPDGATKPTKVPYQVNGRDKARSDDAQTWTSFEKAVAACPPPDQGGLGFVFAEDDPWCGIDLDNPYARDKNNDYIHADPNRVAERHGEILKACQSYSEISPSGDGIHILAKGRVPSGRKRDGVEIYSSGRFFTMTAKMHRQLPLTDIQEQLDILWEQMGTPAQAMNIAGDYFQHEDDAEIYRQACDARNGDLFKRLWDGDWSGYRPNQDGTASSEADFALIDIIAYYTQHRQQIERMFLASALGRREKYKRKQLIGYMISKSFDLMPPAVDLDVAMNIVAEAFARLPHPGTAAPAYAAPVAAQGVRAEVLTGLPPATVIPYRSEVFGYDLDYWRTNPPQGLVGDILEFYRLSSALPVYEFGIVSALALMAGMAGRQYNASNSGLNLYLMAIADTGKGKEGIAKAFSRLTAAIIGPAIPSKVTGELVYEFHVAKDIVGPGTIASGQALIKHMAAKSVPVCTAIIGEFGLKLRQITMPNPAPQDLTLRSVLLDIYNKSGSTDTINPAIYANTDNNTKTIYSPALTLVGESTGQNFYQALDEDNVTEGLIPRMLIIDYSGPRVDFNYDAFTYSVPSLELRNKLRDVLMRCHTMANTGEFHNISTTDEALTELRAMDKRVQGIINSTLPPVQKEVWNRCVQKMWRVCGLLAVGLDYKNPTITIEHVKWAGSLVMCDIDKLLKKFDVGEIGVKNIVNDQSEYIRREIIRFVKGDNLPKNADMNLQPKGVVARSYLQQRLIGSKPFRNEKDPTRAVHNAIQSLIDNGQLLKLSDKELAAVSTKRGFHVVCSDAIWLSGV